MDRRDDGTVDWWEEEDEAEEEEEAEETDCVGDVERVEDAVDVVVVDAGDRM